MAAPTLRCSSYLKEDETGFSEVSDVFLKNSARLNKDKKNNLNEKLRSLVETYEKDGMMGREVTDEQYATEQAWRQQYLKIMSRNGQIGFPDEKMRRQVREVFEAQCLNDERDNFGLLGGHQWLQLLRKADLVAQAGEDYEDSSEDEGSMLVPVWPSI